MAYLNTQERLALLNDLKTMSFNRAKGKLRKMDPKGYIAFLRNAQQSRRLFTRFDLHGMGTIVTLIEQEVDTVTPDVAYGSNMKRNKSKMELVEVVVEPMPENRT